MCFAVFSISKWMFLLTSTSKRAHHTPSLKFLCGGCMSAAELICILKFFFFKWHFFYLWLSVFGLFIYERLLFIDCLVNEKCYPNKVRLIGWMNISETLWILLRVLFLGCASHTAFMTCATHRNPLKSSFFSTEVLQRCIYRLLWFPLLLSGIT